MSALGRERLGGLQRGDRDQLCELGGNRRWFCDPERAVPSATSLPDCDKPHAPAAGSIGPGSDRPRGRAAASLGAIDEFVDLDRPCRFQSHFLELLLRHLDKGVGVDLVALDDVLVGDFLAGIGVDLGVFDAVASLPVELIERDLLGFRRGWSTIALKKN